MERWPRYKAWLYSVFNGNPASNSSIVQFAGVGTGDRVLDVGCGPGAALREAQSAGAEIFGVDPSEAMVARAAGIQGATVREGSAESIPFESDQFSHVWTISAFHHWSDIKPGLAEARRVLMDHGRFFIVERQLKPDKSGHGLNQAEAQQTLLDLESTGFTDCRLEDMAANRKTYLVVSGSA